MHWPVAGKVVHSALFARLDFPSFAGGYGTALIISGVFCLIGATGLSAVPIGMFAIGWAIKLAVGWQRLWDDMREPQDDPPKPREQLPYRKVSDDR